MIKLVVGLGNPGKEYAETRHNLGFMVVDSYLAKKRGRYAEQKSSYQLATLRVAGRKLYLAKPMTFMNLSGSAVRTLLNHLEMSPAETLVICDDFALPFGKLRIRVQGSDGGHNGLASIINELGSEEFPRLRMGIGPAPEGVPFEKFVLEPFLKEELDRLGEFVKFGVNCLETGIYSGLEEAMQKYNGM